jgi:hypothetical protein
MQSPMQPIRRAARLRSEQQVGATSGQPGPGPAGSRVRAQVRRSKSAMEVGGRATRKPRGLPTGLRQTASTSYLCLTGLKQGTLTFDFGID